MYIPLCFPEINGRGGGRVFGGQFLLSLFLTYLMLNKILTYSSPHLETKIVNCKFALKKQQNISPIWHWLKLYILILSVPLINTNIEKCVTSRLTSRSD